MFETYQENNSRTSAGFFETHPLGSAHDRAGRRPMRKLPKSIDADVIIEISRYLEDRPKSTPVPVHKLASMIQHRVKTGLSLELIEELIVEMAATRLMPMLFDLPDVEENVISLALARAS
jgi:hypothetical protein